VIANDLILKFKSKASYPVIRNIFWLSFDKVFKLLIGLFVGIWVARYLGPSQLGELNYVLAIITILVTVVNLGMDGFLIKEIIEHPTQKNEYLGTSFVMRLLLIPIVLAAVVLYFYQIGLSSNYFLLLGFLSLYVIITPFDLIDLDFQSRLQSKKTVVAKNIAYILGAMTKIYLITNNKPLIWFAASMGIETILSYIFLTIFYQANNNIFHWTFNKSLIKDLLKIGWPFILSNLAVILYMRIDQVMIGYIIGEKELGLFSSVVKISDIFIFIPMAVASSYLPSLIAARKAGEKQFLESIQFFTNWMMRISLLIALSISIFSSLIIQVLYGSEYASADSILLIHIWSLVPIFLGVAGGQYLVIENLQKYNLIKTTLGLGSNVVLNLILIPKYGAIGAATATIISYIISAVLSNLFFQKTQILFKIQLSSFKMIFKFSKNFDNK
jgi:PST family polysaccharide transporter